MPTRELKNANITHVSYVDKGANQKKFFLTKSEEKPVFEKQVKVLTKNEDEQKLVYGVVYEPDVVDAHGDFMKAEEIEKSAHQFMKDARNIDTQHNFETGAGEVVESYVAPADITIGDETIAKGSWVLVTKATDEIWDSIQKGEITGYSMAGTAEVIEVEKTEEKQMKNFFQVMKEFFTGEDIIKGAVKDKFNEGKKKREFFDAYWIFEDYFFDAVWAGDAEKVKEYAQDFAELLTEIANSPDVLKALGDIKKSEEVVRVKAEDLKALLKEELAPVTARLEALEKSEEQQEENTEEQQTEEDVQKEEEQKQEDLVKSFKAVLKEELTPISERLEAVEKARGMSKKVEKEEEQSSEEKVEKSVWRGLLGN